MRHYAYDAIGNLIQDAAEDINNIQWTVYGKVKKVDRGSPKHDITFNYGPDGQRISKTVFYDYTGVANDSTVTTYYVRDASGNIMATYRYTAYGLGGDEFYLGEQHIYGSSRIGYREANLDLQTAPVGGPSTAGVIYVERGRKRYEMSNHLGNVLSVISDRRKLICNPPTGVGMDPTPGYYQADIIMATDYSSFGAPMVARNWNSAEYKFGFNGQLKDDEVYGNGNSYAFSERMYDPRLGRLLSPDPLTATYPWYTPYQFAGNTPIKNIDLLGAQPTGNMADWDIQKETIKLYADGLNGISYFVNDCQCYVYSRELPNVQGHEYFWWKSGETKTWEKFKDDYESQRNYQTTMYALTDAMKIAIVVALVGTVTAEIWVPMAGEIILEELSGIPMPSVDDLFRRGATRALTEVFAESWKKIVISDKKIYRDGYHFNKHGREMGYKSVKEYDQGAKMFAESAQNSKDVKVVDGIWKGGGKHNQGREQRAFMMEGKTVIVDKESGNVINFYNDKGSGVGQNFEITKEW